MRDQDLPIISVLMSVFNTPSENLRVAIKSILTQTYQNFEFVIVDDGSERPTQLVLNEFEDDRLKVIRHNRNRGTAAAANTGIGASQGEYLVRMDSDDWVEPSYVDTLYQAIRQWPEYTAVSCRAQEYRDDGDSGPVVGSVGEKTSKSIIRGDMPVHGASIMRRADVVGVGGYPQYKRGEDKALWSELILNGKRLRVIEPILYHYRVNLSDYRKRKLRNRRDSISAALYYYPKLGASVFDYRYIAKSIIAGLLPSKVHKVVSEKLRGRD